MTLRKGKYLDSFLGKIRHFVFNLSSLIRSSQFTLRFDLHIVLKSYLMTITEAERKPMTSFRSYRRVEERPISRRRFKWLAQCFLTLIVLYHLSLLSAASTGVYGFTPVVLGSPLSP